jgi:C-terminal processing protease CtpA/Prc
MRKMRFACLAVVLALAAQDLEAGPPDPGTLRLAGLARLYEAVRFFHPEASRDPAAWDAAVERAIPQVRDAKDPAALRDAVQAALATLRDAATRVLDASGPASHGPLPGRKVEPDGILVLTLGGACGGCFALLGETAAAMSGPTRGVIFDLRGGTEDSEATDAVDISGFGELLNRTEVRAPGVRTRFYGGWVPESGTSSGGYTAGFRVHEGALFRPSKSARDLPAVFIVSEGASAPGLARAMQTAGRAAIVVEGPTGKIAAPLAWKVDIAEGVAGAVRVGDEEVGVRFVPDAVVSPSTGDDRAMREARAQIRTLPRAPSHGAPAPAPTIVSSHAPAEDPEYPPEPRRILAAIKLWAVIDLFFPYRDLMDEDWDETLVEFLPRFAAAKDAVAYGRTVAAMAAHTHDSHVVVRGGAMSASWGEAPAPVHLRVIEGEFVVTRLLDGKAASGLRIGDVVVSVDGERAAAIRARLAKEQSVSTPQALDDRLAKGLLRGPDGSEATVVVRGADGAERTVGVPRRKPFQTAARDQRDGDVVRVLPGGVGYVDLDRLRAEETDAMFETLKAARAIVFDMRGYPNGTAWTIAPRLAKTPETVAARFDRPLVFPSSSRRDGRGTETFFQRLPPSTKPRWKGKTVMLLDERSISQAEHTGLFFRAANGTRFVGSPTNGANGDVTRLRLPGNLVVSFTGQSVRHPDGRALQRVGLVPDVLVKPTLAGIRAGRDEVLERALVLLSEPGASKP